MKKIIVAISGIFVAFVLALTAMFLLCPATINVTIVGIDDNGNEFEIGVEEYIIGAGTLVAGMTEPISYPYRSGYMFIEWGTKDGAGNYVSGFPTNISADTTLYARYMKGSVGLVLGYEEDTSSYTVSGYEGSDTTLVIPDYFEGLPVTMISPMISAGTNITGNATTVYIGNEVREIHYFATDIVVNSDEVITGYTPSNTLEQVYIGRKIEYISSTAFCGCSNVNITMYSRSDNWFWYNSIDDYNNDIVAVAEKVDIKDSSVLTNGFTAGIATGEDTISSVRVLAQGAPGKTIVVSYATSNVDNSDQFSTQIYNNVSSTIGVDIPEPEIPYKVNYMMEGWYTSSSFTEESKVTFPYNVSESTTFYPRLLQGSNTLGYTYSGGTYTVSSYTTTGTDTELVIPDYYDDGTNGVNKVTDCVKELIKDNKIINDVYVGRCVTRIPYHFAENSVIKSINWGHLSELASIDTEAFRNCSNLSSVTLSDSLNYIGGYAFTQCNKLSSIIIPSLVRTIGVHAFSNCDGLTEITIPRSVTEIGVNPFSGCYNIKKIVVDEENKIYFSSVNGLEYNAIMVVMNDGNIQVVAGCKTTPINNLPDSVTSFGNRSFGGMIMDSAELVIPESVTSIGDYAFDHCSGFTSLTLGSNVKTIGTSAFFYCSGLTGELIIPDGVTSIGNSAFSACSGLTGRLKIPDGVTSIGDYAFFDCVGFASLTLGSNVETIGLSVFSECTSLTGELIIPTSVTSIGENAFGETQFDSISVSEDNAVFNDYDINILVDTTTGVLIAGCKASVISKIPDNVIRIGNSAFEGCTALTGDLVIPASVTSIGDNAFDHCSGFTSLTLGSGVEIIGWSAFSSCTGLTGELIIPDGVTSIGQSAFYNCAGINTLTLGRNVETIGSSAFSDCTGLTGELIIPSSVASIGDRAFLSCKNLTSITIPSSVTSIGYCAFQYCDKLSDLTFANTNGWRKSSNSNFTSNVSDVDVSDPEQNVTWLTKTSGYYDYYWMRKDDWSV